MLFRSLKRKAKEQVAGGMGDIKAAISAVEEDIPVAVKNSIADESGTDATEGPKAKPKPKPGQIGEGKGAPLSKNQRKRALYVPTHPPFHPGAAPSRHRSLIERTHSRHGPHPSF